MKQIRKRLTYANVMSSVAIFLVLGGAAVAAVQLPKNSVGTKQLKKNAVNSSKVKDGSLTGADINLSSLGTVPSATNAAHASAADNANHATNADNANHADNASHAINADTAKTANSAFSASRDSGIEIPDTLGAGGNPIATLNVPSAGNFVINAKLAVYNASATTDLSGGECTLKAGSDVDTEWFDATASPSDDQEDVPLQLVHTFDSPGEVTLSCSDNGNGNGYAYFTKITAVQVANLTNTGL